MSNTNTEKIIGKVRSLPGDFSSVTDAEIENQIENGDQMYVATIPWLNAGKLDLALALAAAHLLTINNKIEDSPDGLTMAGQTVSINEGDQSINTETSGARNTEVSLSSTVYGRMLVKQKKTIPTTPITGF